MFQRAVHLAHEFVRDINEGNEKAFRYSTLDRFTITILWWNFGILALLTFINSYIRLAEYVQSPFAWRVISYTEAFTVMGIGLAAVLLTILLRDRFKRHYSYRLLITACLVTFSYLFVFVTGGAIEAHFHFFIVIAYIAAYADWRLGWLTLVMTVAHHTILDFLAPGWVFFYGANWLSPLAHGIPVLAAVILTTILSNTWRQTLLTQKELEKRREEFISMASHELKTPVTSITIFTDILQEITRTRHLPEIEGPVTSIRLQLAKLTKLISDLLDISRSQELKLSFSFDVFDINELVEEVAATIREFDTNRSITVRGKALSQVRGDRDRIGQVLVNLLTNALKYSPPTTTVEVVLRSDPQMVTVCVIDQGFGIDTKHHAKIFERFYRVYEGDERTYPGMGIGLYISYEILQKHSGRMWVESEKGKGSKFYFSLPVLPV